MLTVVNCGVVDSASTSLTLRRQVAGIGIRGSCEDSVIALKRLTCTFRKKEKRKGV